MILDIIKIAVMIVVAYLGLRIVIREYLSILRDSKQDEDC